MAKTILWILFTQLLFSSSSIAEHEAFTSPATLLKLRKEKLTHLHFYFHDILSGRHPTAVGVAKANSTSSSATLFGLLRMADDPLTVAPDGASRVVGRAQGMYGGASQSEVAFLMAFNFAFVEGKYNGSVVTLLGRNSVLHGVREMPVVGGSGLFRFARGYAEATTHSFDLKTGNAVVEYNVYVLHY